jgi:hypothetical protein
VSGYGKTIGNALASHMDVNKVAFTGSTTGRRQLHEQGGKSTDCTVYPLLIQKVNAKILLYETAPIHFESEFQQSNQRISLSKQLEVLLSEPWLILFAEVEGFCPTGKTCGRFVHLPCSQLIYSLLFSLKVVLYYFSFLGISIGSVFVSSFVSLKR